MNERIAEWVGWNTWDLPSYDTDITLWHGEDGLLAEIEKKGYQFAMEFLGNIAADWNAHLCPGGVWLQGILTGLVATAAQLAAALCKVIEEDADDQAA